MKRSISPAAGLHSHGLLLLGILGIGSCCGKLVATVPIDKVGTLKEVAVSMPQGSNLSFPVHVDKYSFSSPNTLLLNVDLLKNGSVVGNVKCEGFELEGSAGAGCGSTHSNSACQATVPPGGITSVRVGTSYQNPSSPPTLEGVSVEVRSN